jgi:cystathionine beta-synthase
MGLIKKQTHSVEFFYAALTKLERAHKVFPYMGGRIMNANAVWQLIGQTPLLRLSRSLKNLEGGFWAQKEGLKIPKGFELKSEVWAKLEFLNPGGSVKDRIAKKIIEDAEASGALKPGATIVEATSGNTGAGVALVAAAKGYKTIFVMPDKMSAEKINALRAFGSKVIVSPTKAEPHEPGYYVNVAKKIVAETPGAFMVNQFFNPSNPAAHFETTGPEIWEQMESNIDVFVAGIGTGGTLSGTGNFLKSKNPKIHIVAIDPKGSIYADKIKYGKDVKAEPYLIEGVGEDMIPGTMDLTTPTEVVTITDVESMTATRLLACAEGILAGPSCGAALFGAFEFLARHELSGGKPLRAVLLFPDSGAKYLSKAYNEIWLREKNVYAEWEGTQSALGKVEYFEGAKRVEGV